MPPKTGNYVLDRLQELAPRVAVNQDISFRKYCHSAQLLLNQANDYGRLGDLPQRCLFLTRLAGLVIETIPRHKDFNPRDREYVALKEFLLTKGINEAEEIKKQYREKAAKAAAAPSAPATPPAPAPRRPEGGVQIGLSNLPEIDWGSFAPEAPPSAPAAAAAATPVIDARFFDDLGHPSTSGAAAAGTSTTSSSSSRGPQPPAGSSGAAAAAAVGPPGFVPTSYQSSFTAPSSSSLQKHALFGSRAGSGSYSSSGAAAASALAARPRYPEFDAQPASNSLLDEFMQGKEREKAAAAAAAAAGGSSSAAAAAGLDGAMSSMALSPQQQAAVEVAMQPSAGPSPAPQEMEVTSIVPSGRRIGTCSEPPPPDSFLHTAEGGPKPLPKRMELRTVHISMALMNDFLHFANRNTKRGIESCGILAGSLAGDASFMVSTLIIPKQEGTSDTVAALNEEEIFDAQFSRGLYPLGWIHTHPTQTCFLSSVDVHTQCGYQTMLDEAVAIVMAPSDRKNKVGIFRLTTPGGLSLIQKCTLRGFHPHPATETGQDLYELCGHVFLNPGAKHEVLDLR